MSDNNQPASQLLLSYKIIKTGGDASPNPGTSNLGKAAITACCPWPAELGATPNFFLGPQQSQKSVSWC